MRLLLLPAAVGWEYRRHGDALNVTVEPVLNRLAPLLVMGRVPVRVDGRVVLVDLVKMEAVRVLRVLKDVEPEAAGLISDLALGVAEAGRLELVREPVLDLNRHEYGYHRSSYWLGEIGNTQVVDSGIIFAA